MLDCIVPPSTAQIEMTSAAGTREKIVKLSAATSSLLGYLTGCFFLLILIVRYGIECVSDVRESTPSFGPCYSFKARVNA